MTTETREFVAMAERPPTAAGGVAVAEAPEAPAEPEAAPAEATRDATPDVPVADEASIDQATSARASRLLLPRFPFKLVWSPRKSWWVTTTLSETQVATLFEATMAKKPNILRRANNYFRRVRWVVGRNAVGGRLIATCYPMGLVQVGLGKTKRYVDVSGDTIECTFGERAADGRTRTAIGVGTYTTLLGFYLYPAGVYIRDLLRAIKKLDRAADVKYPWSPFRMVALTLVLVSIVYAVATSGGGGAGRAASPSSGESARSAGSQPVVAPPPAPQPAPTPPAASPPPPAVAPPPSPAATLPDRPSTDPRQLADEIDRAEHTLLDRSSTGNELQRAGRFQQLAIRVLRRRPELRRPTLALLTASAATSMQTGVRAANALSGIVPPQKSLPTWKIVAPPPPGRLLEDYRAAEAAYGVRWEYLAAIHLVETRMGRIRGPSTSGAQGPMQFLPSTWAKYGRGDIDSARDSIMAAARLLVANGAPGDMSRALYSYNPDHGYVTAIQLYAGQMMKNPRAFYGYYYWQVLYKHVSGTLILPVGYPSIPPENID